MPCKNISTISYLFPSVYSGLVLPVPTLSDLNCSGQTKESTLTISCTPTSATIAQLLCALDGGELTVCGGMSVRVGDKVLLIKIEM